MLNSVSIMFIFFSALTSIYCNQKRYDNYTVYRIVPITKEQVEILRQIETMKGNSFWVEPFGLNPVDLQIAPTYLNKFNEMATKAGMKPQILIDDLQKEIDNEKTIFKSRTVDDSFDFKVYNTLEQIYDWMEQMIMMHETVQKIVAGQTYEGREIQGLRLRFGELKPAIFIEGGMHGREWISPASVVYLMDRLLHSADPALREVAEAYDWYIIPVCNPDSYVYSQKHDRMWQKTVSDTGRGPNPPDPDCKGVDLNRNFDYMWEQQEGPNTDACHEKYAGPFALSEAESASLSQYIKSLRGKLLAYLSIHSYGQLLLLPYDYTPQHLENYHEAFDIGSYVTETLTRKFNIQYRIGNRAELTGSIISGTAMDWAKGFLQLELAYTYKLRGGKKNGFILAEKYIGKALEEFIESVIAMFQKARNLGYPKDKTIGKCYMTGGEGSRSTSTGCIKKKMFKLPRCFGG